MSEAVDVTPMVDPVVLETTVPITAANAFERWTSRAIEWWPLGHSLGGDRVVGIVYEGEVGGAVNEVWDDGSTRQWGRVLVWEAGRRLVIEWGPADEPWHDQARTEVEVEFTDVDGGCRVRLEHRFWDRLVDGAAMRTSYFNGWPGVIERFRTVG